MYKPRPTLQWSDIPVWVRLALAFFVLDVASFYLIGLVIGGDAARGFSREGKYFLTGNGHTTEVSRAVFYYSYLHLLSLGIALVVAGVGLKRVKPKSVAVAPPPLSSGDGRS